MQVPRMSTPPMTERVTAGARARRTIGRVPTRVIWLTADVIAIAVMALLLLRAL
jgi:hypothetical protein